MNVLCREYVVYMPYSAYALSPIQFSWFAIMQCQIIHLHTDGEILMNS